MNCGLHPKILAAIFDGYTVQALAVSDLNDLSGYHLFSSFIKK